MYWKGVISLENSNENRARCTTDAGAQESRCLRQSFDGNRATAAFTLGTDQLLQRADTKTPRLAIRRRVRE